MSTPIIVPQLESDEPVQVSCWLVAVGEHVQSGDRVVELVMPGITFDVAAPIEGCIAQQLKHHQAEVNPGDTLGWIDAVS